jgi:hypothetical protein
MAYNAHRKLLARMADPKSAPADASDKD